MTNASLIDCKERIRYINQEQKRQIEIHKWIEGQKIGRDPGDAAVLEWVEKYAPMFRAWAETLPYTCIRCGLCSGVEDTGLCPRPFEDKRIKHIETKDKTV